VEAERAAEGARAERAAVDAAEARALAAAIFAIRRYRVGRVIARPLDAARALVWRRP